MSFDQLGLSPEILRAVAAQGYTEPTPVQHQAIPLVLAGRDLLAAAQTGTGKTAAFTLPILQRLRATARPGQSGDARDRRNASRPPVRCLVLTPTRELALQVEESVRTYGGSRPVRSTTIYGGVGFDPQVRALRAGPEIVVATPGRLLDHVTQRTVDLSAVEILVLDEADRMLDMGFIRDIRRILALLPEGRQNLLFSATFSDDIRRLADGLLTDPAMVEVAARNTASELVRQLVLPVDRERKRELLSHLVRSGRIEQALVFARTKHGANRLAQQLERDGISTAAIHGNRSQPQRVRALADFKAGRVAVLVATEIAARGLDIDALPHVVNYELPMVAADYVHRIGRTGRAGADGDAISLVCVDEYKLLADIETLLGRRIPQEVVRGFEPDRSIRPEPIRQRSAEHLARAPRSQHGAARPARRADAGGFAPARRPGPDRRQAAGARPNGDLRVRDGRSAPASGRPADGRREQRGPRDGRPAVPHPVRPRDAASPATAPRPVTLPGERFARAR